jgi:cell division protein FtsL
MKYPRTLNEAFPKTMEYGCSIEKPRLTRVEKVLTVVYSLAALVVMFDLFIWRQ